MNAKVNNWAVELETYNLKFEYIQGIKTFLQTHSAGLLESTLMLNYPWKNQDRNLDTTSSRIYPLLKLGEIIIEGIEIKPDPTPF